MISTAEDLFSHILSKTNHEIELRALPSRLRIFSRDIKELQGFIKRRGNENLYFGVFPREGRDGTKEGVRDVWCFFADLDFKNFPGGEEEAKAKIKAFPLRPSLVLHSGNGFHVYWFLSTVIEASEKAEAILRGIAKELGSDPTVAELARILRIPGTSNYKNDSKKPVKIIHKADLTYSPEAFDRFAETSPAPQTEKHDHAGLAEIVSKCDFIEHCHKHREDLPEPLWYAMVSNVVRLNGGVRLCHALSEGHPSYTQRETEKKILHALNAGPHTCEHIRRNGFECKRECGVKAPIARLNGKHSPGEKASEEGSEKMHLTRLCDLLNEPEDTVDWQLEGILPAGGFSVIAAKPKAGKSTFTRNLALATARGEDFLNRKTSQGAVIYLALEEKRGEVRKHFRAMGAAGDEEIFTFAGSAPKEALEEIRKKAEEIKPSLIIIDPLFRLARVRDGNDYAAVTQALEPLLRLARDTGSHVLCVHHTSKGEGREAGDSVLGSTAIFSSVDTLLIIRRLENYRTIQTRQRYGDDLDETTLNFDKERRLLTIGKTREEEDISSHAEAIKTHLDAQEEGITEAAIMAEVEGRTGIKRKALRELVKAGEVIRSGKGSKGDPFKYSRFVVPNIYMGTRERESENGFKASNDAIYSRSHDFTNHEKSGNENPDTGNGLPVDFDLSGEEVRIIS